MKPSLLEACKPMGKLRCNSSIFVFSIGHILTTLNILNYLISNEVLLGYIYVWMDAVMAELERMSLEGDVDGLHDLIKVS